MQGSLSVVHRGECSLILEATVLIFCAVDRLGWMHVDSPRRAPLSTSQEEAPVPRTTVMGQRSLRASTFWKTALWQLLGANSSIDHRKWQWKVGIKFISGWERRCFLGPRIRELRPCLAHTNWFHNIDWNLAGWFRLLHATNFFHNLEKASLFPSLSWTSY